MTTVRLDRLLANLGYGSRRDANRLVRDGHVTVDNSAITDPATKVEPSVVRVDGEPLDHPAGIFVALHKPVGHVCSHADEEGETIYQLLPAHWLARSPRPESVGRLDKETSGLLLVTDDGALLHRLTSPRQHIPKTYLATLARPVEHELVEVFAAGTLLLRGEVAPCAPAELEIVDSHTARVVLDEGRYHQVRRMFAACGNHVETLHRTHVGDWSLDGLAPGEWRDAER
jgi:16S rRNA pseudouridine516 synthase